MSLFKILRSKKSVPKTSLEASVELVVFFFLQGCTFYLKWLIVRFLNKRAIGKDNN